MLFYEFYGSVWPAAEVPPQYQLKLWLSSSNSLLKALFVRGAQLTLMYDG